MSSQESRKSNIFQVLSESDLNEIIIDHGDKLLTVMHSVKNDIPNVNFVKLKYEFVELAKQNPESFFAFVNLNEFITKNDMKVNSLMNILPRFVFYFAKTEVASINRASKNTLHSTFTQLKTKIAEKMSKKNESQPEPPKQDASPHATGKDANAQPAQSAPSEPAQPSAESQTNKQLQEQLAQLKEIERVSQLKKEYDMKQLQHIQKMKEIEENKKQKPKK